MSEPKNGKSDAEDAPRPPAGSLIAFRKRRPNKVPSGSIHPKAALVGRFATTSLAYNGTPAQPQFTQWGQLGEILGGVRVPERGASRGLAVRPSLGK